MKRQHRDRTTENNNIKSPKNRKKAKKKNTLSYCDLSFTFTVKIVLSYPWVNIATTTNMIHMNVQYEYN